MDGDRGDEATSAPERPRRLPRRLLLTGGGAAVLAVLVDRGLRLDLPQPPPPVPTRRPAPDEQLLLASVGDLAALLAAADRLVSAGGRDGRDVRPVRAVLRDQRRVLAGRLTNAGVPSSLLDAAARSAVSSAEKAGDRDAFAALLIAVPAARWSAVADATPGTRRLLLSALAARMGGAASLGGDVTVPPTPSPARPAVVARTQPLVYAFEVVAAQSRGAQRTRAEDTLEVLRRLELAVSGSSSATPTGWALPFAVTTPTSAARLAREVLGDTVDALADVAGAGPSAAAFEDVARWSGRVQALAVDWDVPLTAFPGTAS